MILQAYQYEDEENNFGWLQEFFDSVQGLGLLLFQ